MKKLATAALILAAGLAQATDCPPYPAQENTSMSGSAEAAAANAATKLGTIKGPNVRIEAQRQTSEVLSKYPDANKAYITQLMSAMYCRQLENDKQLTGLQRAQFMADLKLGAESASSQAKTEAQTPRASSNAKPSSKSAAKPARITPETPPRDVSEWANERLSIMMSYKVIRADNPPTQVYSVQTNYWMFFKLIGPYLYQELPDAVLREKAALMLSEKYLFSVCAFGCELTISETAWQDIAYKFRTEKLASIGPSPINGNVVWRETPYTREALQR